MLTSSARSSLRAGHYSHIRISHLRAAWAPPRRSVCGQNVPYEASSQGSARSGRHRPLSLERRHRKRCCASAPAAREWPVRNRRGYRTGDRRMRSAGMRLSDLVCGHVGDTRRAQLLLHLLGKNRELVIRHRPTLAGLLHTRYNLVTGEGLDHPGALDDLE